MQKNTLFRKVKIVIKNTQSYKKWDIKNQHLKMLVLNIVLDSFLKALSFAIGETLSGLLLFLFNNKALKHSFSPK